MSRFCYHDVSHTILRYLALHTIGSAASNIHVDRLWDREYAVYKVSSGHVGIMKTLPPPPPAPPVLDGPREELALVAPLFLALLLEPDEDTRLP